MPRPLKTPGRHLECSCLPAGGSIPVLYSAQCDTFRDSSRLVLHNKTFGSFSAAQVNLLNYWKRAHAADGAGGRFSCSAAVLFFWTFFQRQAVFLDSW